MIEVILFLLSFVGSINVKLTTLLILYFSGGDFHTLIIAQGRSV